MISKITMNSVASFKKATVLETDKKVNLLYGLNGVGKSTLSSFLYKPENPRFSSCSIEGLEDNDTILVYNLDFIRDHFYEAEGINGIFTLSKKNTQVNKEIEKVSKEIRELSSIRLEKNQKKEKNEAEYKKKIDTYINKIWNIKTNYAGGDRVLEFCLDGLKGNKLTLFNHLIAISCPENVVDYSIDDLKAEAKTLQGELKEKNLIQTLEIKVEDLENSELLSKVIVGNKNSSVSDLIDKLGNSDWVNEGTQYVHMDGEKASCPFCQQKTITNDFLEEIKNYFDQSYQEDKEKLSKLRNEYNERTITFFEFIKEIKENEYLDDEKQKIEEIEFELKNAVEQNKKILLEKEKTPSIVIELKGIKYYEDEINNVVSNINRKIIKYNEKIRDVKGSKENLKNKFWTKMRQDYSDIIDLYFNEEKNYKKNIALLEKEIKEKENEINKKLAYVSEIRKDTVNIDDAVENIKTGLVDIGITDFTIEKYSEEEALYRLKREGENTEKITDDNIFKTLSEGEKMVISFLYFIELCKGEETADKTTNNKIIVIDDPISSLSHIYVFNIGRLIHNEFLRTKKYNQIFVLTHSLYFFYELTNLRKEEREANQKLFRICKNYDGSSFAEMKYEEIQNDYQAYWSIINDSSQPPALIANCMRNILEYFFNFVEKQDFNNVFQKPVLQKTEYQAFNRYMNRESHSKGQNIFDIKEFDYVSFKEAFKQVFYCTGYRVHYDKMSKIKFRQSKKDI